MGLPFLALALLIHSPFSYLSHLRKLLPLPLAVAGSAAVAAAEPYSGANQPSNIFKTTILKSFQSAKTSTLDLWKEGRMGYTDSHRFQQDSLNIFFNEKIEE
jgi:hypothetical protein